MSPTRARLTIPADFSTWRACRDYHALEALFLLQHYDRNKTRANRARWKAAADKALAANDQVVKESKHGQGRACRGARG